MHQTVDFLSPPPSLPGVNDLVFLFHVDIIILSFFAFFAVCTLPRLFQRLSRRSEWFCGLFLHSYNSANEKKKPYRAISTSNGLISRSDLLLESGPRHGKIAQKEMPSKDLPPYRIPSWSSHLYGVSTVLGREVATGYSIGRLVVFLGYFGILLYAGTYKASPFSYWIREGVITASQVPIVFALATKNNVLGSLLAVGYEKLNWLHRFLGRLMLVIASLHALGFFYTWSSQGVFLHYIKNPLPIHGLVTLTGLNILVWFSVPFFRQNYYKIFLGSHIVGFILFPVGLALHAPAARPYVYAGVGIYAFDHVLRIFKTRIMEAAIITMPELGMTRIEIPRLNAGWRPGQHVRIRIISSGMGLLGWCEAHPFTIAGISGDGMVLMCKKTGDWTNKLYQFAQGGKSHAHEEGRGGRNVTVIVEGPYGGIGHTLMNSFSGALFISGGSGITFSLAAIQDLVMKDAAVQSRVKVVQLVWSVQDANSLVPMLPTFNALMNQAPDTRIQIAIYYTRSLKSPVDLRGMLSPNIVVSPGRPETSSIISSMIDKTLASSSPYPLGIVVGVCGPASLGQHVREAVGNVNPALRKHVGGIELCEEVFGL